MSQLEKISSDKIVYALLFLLPIFAVTVRHWVSDIFTILSLTSLVMLYRQRKQRSELLPEEKILLWGFAVYFSVFVLTSLVNGWGSVQTRHLGVEIRFLLFIPLYLLVRQMNHGAKWLIFGSVFGVIFTAYACYQEVIIKHAGGYKGMYSPLFTGPIILLLATLSITYFYARIQKKWLKLSLLLLVGMAFFVVAQTGARNAYMAAIILCGLFILHQYKGLKRYLLVVMAVILSYGSYVFVETINSRVNTAYQEYKTYFAYPNPAKVAEPLSSVGTRLEMWRVTPFFFKDNPVFGVGRGNYSDEIKKYIDQGMIHKDVGHHGHPHNVYSEAIISKGLIGILALFWIMLYPLFVLVKDYRKGYKSAFYGIVLISAYMVFSLTDASTLIKGNYSSIYIIFMAVSFTYHIQRKQKITTK